MKTARMSDAVQWWAMGRAAVAKYGTEHALEMAAQIRTEGNRRLFLDGAQGRPRPMTRRGVAP